MLNEQQLKFTIRQIKYFFKKAYGQLVLLDFDITAYTSMSLST